MGSRLTGRELAFRRRVLSWYARNGRRLPWRDCPDAYHVLLSEIMLQQTQVGRVLQKHPEFLGRFPSLHALARAARKDVVIAWRGLGYNNRAVRLHMLAQTLVDRHGGTIPASYEALVALPGVGRYTANALLASVHDHDVAVVDINIHRLFSRFFGRMQERTALMPARTVWPLAERLVPRGRGYAWSQALMDMGATVCTARQPRCTICPVARSCRSRAALQHLEPSRMRPTRGETPDRVYRGRIIEQLREAPTARGIRADLLGRRLWPRGAAEGRMERLLAALERDGLVTVRGRGPFLRRRVTLA